MPCFEHNSRRADSLSSIKRRGMTLAKAGLWLDCIRHLLDSMPATPAYLVDAAYNILAWSQLATQFIGNLAGHADRNMIRWTRRSPAESVWSDEHLLRFTRSTVADLRAG